MLNRMFGVTRLALGATLLLVAVACGYEDGMTPTEAIQVETPEAFEAHLIRGGATPSLARIIRHATELKEGEALHFGPAGSLEFAGRALREYSLPDGMAAVVVPRGGSR